MQASIDEATRDLERYDRTISELEAELDKLKKLRDDTVQKRINPRNSLLSPIRKIPSEVLIEIFNDVAEPITFTGEHSGKLSSPVFPLTWVCAWWRSLVISESQLWSSFKIRCSYHFTPEFVEFIRAYFQDQCMQGPKWSSANKTKRKCYDKFGYTTFTRRHSAPPGLVYRRICS